MEAAARLAPVVRLTLRETEDAAADAARLRAVRAVIERYERSEAGRPGSNRVQVRIVTLGGDRVLAEWRALATKALRRELAMILAAWAVGGEVEP